MQAILEAQLPVEIAAVISNKADAKGVELLPATASRLLWYTTTIFQPRYLLTSTPPWRQRSTASDLAVWAGFMRISTPEFVTHHQGCLINIILPLPAFSNTRLVEQAT